MASYTIVSTMEAWASQHRRTREHNFAIQKALADIRSGFSFQRRAGLHKLLATLCLIDTAAADGSLASFNISRDVSRAVFPQGTVTAVPSHPLCAVTWQERVLGLSILQGLCAQSPQEADQQAYNTHVIEAVCNIVIQDSAVPQSAGIPSGHLWAAMDYLETVMYRRPRVLGEHEEGVIQSILNLACASTASVHERVRAVEFLAIMGSVPQKDHPTLETAVMKRWGPKWAAAILSGSTGFVMQSVTLEDSAKASHYAPMLKAIGE